MDEVELIAFKRHYQKSSDSGSLTEAEQSGKVASAPDAVEYMGSS